MKLSYWQSRTTSGFGPVIIERTRTAVIQSPSYNRKDYHKPERVKREFKGILAVLKAGIKIGEANATKRKRDDSDE